MEFHKFCTISELVKSGSLKRLRVVPDASRTSMMFRSRHFKTTDIGAEKLEQCGAHDYRSLLGFEETTC